MKKYLISYGDHNYTGQKERFRKTAEASSFFDEIRIFEPEDIAQGFLDQVGETIQVKKGGGYWLWKPHFIKRALNDIRENDILIYCDAGCMINPRAKERFDEYIEMLLDAETGTLGFELSFKEYEYTKKEVFEHFRSPLEIISSNQLMATVILFKKCAHTTMLVDKWHDVATKNTSLFTDEKVDLQLEGFIDHRHDQSIFSVIRKTFGANTIPDETYFLDFIEKGRNFPIWATRFRG